MIRQVTDPGELIEFFSDDPRVHIYALVDVEEPFWSASTWYRRGDAVVGLVGLPDGDGGAVYAVSTRDPEACLVLVGELAARLPAGHVLTGPLGLGDVLRNVRTVVWNRRYNRYHLADAGQLPDADPRVVPLGPADRSTLAALYQHEPGAAFFRASMLENSSFVGVFDHDELVSAAGTHVLSGAQRVAAIGAVYTLPSHRGRGLGRLVTAGVCHRISDRVDTIGLNVTVGNAAARKVYETIGFVPLMAYEEAEVA